MKKANWRRSRRWTAQLLIILGVVLLSISLLGQWTKLGNYPNVSTPRVWEQFEPTLAKSTSSTAALYKVAEKRAGVDLRTFPPNQAMNELYQVVIDRLTHGDQADYNPWSNWLLYSMGAIHLYSGRGSSAQVKNIVEIITSRENNSFVSYPPGAQFVWKAQVLLEIEKLANILKFFIPIALVAIGSWLFYRRVSI